MDDLISRQAAIKSIQECADAAHDNYEWDVEEGYLNSIDCIEALPSAQPTGTKTVQVDDCISRQAAIETVKKHYRVDNDLLEVIAYEIEALPPAQPGWIPCTPESKPKRCEYYLVTDDGYTEEAYLDCDGVWFSLDGNKLKDVTAWMEKPEPYKGGQDDE